MIKATAYRFTEDGKVKKHTYTIEYAWDYSNHEWDVTLRENDWYRGERVAHVTYSGDIKEYVRKRIEDFTERMALKFFGFDYVSVKGGVSA